MTSRKYFLGMLAILMIVISRIAFAESTQTFAIPECRAIATISFSNGQAQAIGGSMMVPSGYTVSTTAVLQKKVDTAWVRVTSSTGCIELLLTIGYRPKENPLLSLIYLLHVHAI